MKPIKAPHLTVLVTAPSGLAPRSLMLRKLSGHTFAEPFGPLVVLPSVHVPAAVMRSQSPALTLTPVFLQCAVAGTSTTWGFSAGCAAARAIAGSVSRQSEITPRTVAVCLHSLLGLEPFLMSPPIPSARYLDAAQRTIRARL